MEPRKYNTIMKNTYFLVKVTFYFYLSIFIMFVYLHMYRVDGNRLSLFRKWDRIIDVTILFDC